MAALRVDEGAHHAVLSRCGHGPLLVRRSQSPHGGPSPAAQRHEEACRPTGQCLRVEEPRWGLLPGVPDYDHPLELWRE